jgi:hypothetical protein
MRTKVRERDESESANGAVSRLDHGIRADILPIEPASRRRGRGRSVRCSFIAWQMQFLAKALLKLTFSHIVVELYIVNMHEATAYLSVDLGRI